MTTMKRLMRRLDAYTLDVFNAPQTHASTRARRQTGRHAAR